MKPLSLYCECKYPDLRKDGVCRICGAPLRPVLKIESDTPITIDGTNNANFATTVNTTSGKNTNELGKPAFLLSTSQDISKLQVSDLLGVVSGVGYKWVWLSVRATIKKAEAKAIRELVDDARSNGAQGVIGMQTNVAFFPGFLFFRGCAVQVSATAVKFLK